MARHVGDSKRLRPDIQWEARFQYYRALVAGLDSDEAKGYAMFILERRRQDTGTRGQTRPQKFQGSKHAIPANFDRLVGLPAEVTFVPPEFPPETAAHKDGLLVWADWWYENYDQLRGDLCRALLAYIEAQNANDEHVWPRGGFGGEQNDFWHRDRHDKLTNNSKEAKAARKSANEWHKRQQALWKELEAARDKYEELLSDFEVKLAGSTPTSEVGSA